MEMNGGALTGRVELDLIRCSGRRADGIVDGAQIDGYGWSLRLRTADDDGIGFCRKDRRDGQGRSAKYMS